MLVQENRLKQIITGLYDTFSNVLILPDSKEGIPKYQGTTQPAKRHIAKVGEKRNSTRPGLGFLMWYTIGQSIDGARLTLDVEIDKAVTNKDPEALIQNMSAYADNKYQTQAPSFLLYQRPAASGIRGFGERAFVGIELTVANQDLHNREKLKRTIHQSIQHLFNSLDYALTDT